MRETINKTERVRFVCDNESCKKEEIVMFRNQWPEPPLGWVYMNCHDAHVSIEGKGVTLGKAIDACSCVCLFAALEDAIDEALDKTS